MYTIQSPGVNNTYYFGNYEIGMYFVELSFNGKQEVKKIIKLH